MFKSFLAVVFVFMASPALADVPTQAELDQSALNERQRSYSSCMANRGSQADCQGELRGPSEQPEGINTAPGTGESPTSPSGGGQKQTSAQKAQATQQAQAEALQKFVEPTNSRHFSLAMLNSDREAALVINNSNAENNVVFRVIRLIGMLVGTLAILLYIVAGYFMIFSMGDENSLTKGKQIVTYTSLGLVLTFTAYMVIQLIMGLMYFVG